MGKSPGVKLSPRIPIDPNYSNSSQQGNDTLTTNQLENSLSSKYFILPGPGKYSPTEDKPKYGYTIGKSEKRKLVDACSPGPGKYKDFEKIKVGNESSIRISFGSSRTEPKYFNFSEVGPGRYNPQEPQKRIQGYKINEKKNRSKSPPQSYITPGPGHFDPNNPVHTSPKIGFSLAKRAEMLLNKETPSPAQYQKIMPEAHEKALKDGPAFSLRLKPQFNAKRHVSPSPCQYNTNDCNAMKPNGPNVLIGTSERPNLHAIPGTDQLYYIPLNEGPKISFTKAPTNNTIEKTYDPGPGSYNSNLHNSIGQIPNYVRRSMQKIKISMD